MIKTSFSFFNSFRFSFFSLFLFLILASNSYPIKPSAGLVVLPLTADSNLIEVRNRFSDHLIKKLKDTGYNAIGTRYLSSALKMGSCDSEDCMQRIASLVGARYVIFGSVTGDTNTYKLAISVKDLLENKHLLATNRLLSGGAQAALYYTDELTLLISQCFDGATPLKEIDTAAPGAPDIETTKKETTIDSVIEITQQPRENNSDTADIVDSADSAQSDSSVRDPADSNLTRSEINDSMKVITIDNRLTELKNDTYIITEQNTSSVKPVQSQKSDVEDSFSDKQVSLNSPHNVYTPPPVYDNRSILKPLPRQLNQQFFRGARLLVFGNTAMAGLISGLIINDRVKKGLNKEAELYLQHKNAPKKDIISTYDSYIKQTEKTDRYSKLRNAMYAVSGVCALGFTISIFF